MRPVSLPVWLTLLLVAVTIPHAIEDLRFGEFEHHGVPASAALVALAIVYAVQCAGVMFSLRKSRAGLWALALSGALWCVGAVALHGSEIIASGPYRCGYLSKGLEILIIVLGAAVAITAWRAIIRPQP